MKGHAAFKAAVYTRSYRSIFKKFLCKVGAAVGIVCVPITIFDAYGCPAGIVGSSMEPTLHGSDTRWWKRDIVWQSRLGLHKPQIGQVYTFISPDDPSKRHIKRLIAREGDIIRSKRSRRDISIPEGSCWMESDNPTYAKDSNSYGPVSQGLLTGRATHIIWPPERWQALEAKILETNSRRRETPLLPYMTNISKFFGDVDDDDFD